MIKVWHLEREEYLNGFKAHVGFVTSLTPLDLNKEMLISSGGDGDLKIWETN